MRIEDIIASIVAYEVAGTRVSEVEDAFRALVGWPHEDRIDGATPANLKTALERCCEVLKGDDRILPGHVADFIQDEAGEPVATYAQGAAAVLAHKQRFFT